ncbi:MAG: hypothetical protein EOP06_16095 [Proteobacteria bacterium]|nr:MAG: hypothetical protein EOP06_16095 [Pseudomonadota bacterium]
MALDFVALFLAWVEMFMRMIRDLIPKATQPLPPLRVIAEVHNPPTSWLTPQSVATVGAITVTLLLFWLKARSDSWNEIRKLKIIEYDKRINLLSEMLSGVHSYLQAYKVMDTHYNIWKKDLDGKLSRSVPISDAESVKRMDQASTALDSFLVSSIIYGDVTESHNHLLIPNFYEGLRGWAEAVDEQFFRNRNFDVALYDEASRTIRGCLDAEKQKKARLLDARIGPIYENWNLLGLVLWRERERKAKRERKLVSNPLGRTLLLFRIFYDLPKERHKLTRFQRWLLKLSLTPFKMKMFLDITNRFAKVARRRDRNTTVQTQINDVNLSDSTDNGT